MYSPLCQQYWREWMACGHQSATMILTWAEEVVSKQNCSYAIQHFLWILYQGRSFLYGMENGSQSGERQKEIPWNSWWPERQLDCDVGFGLQTITERFEPLPLQGTNLDLGWGLFWDGSRILSRENLPQVLVSLSQRTWIMENLPELCGSSSLLLSCDAENEPFPLGPAARSGFGVTVFCTYVNRYKGLFVSTTEYLKWDQSCRSKGRIWPWVWISLKDTILSSLLVNELQSL